MLSTEELVRPACSMHRFLLGISAIIFVACFHESLAPAAFWTVTTIGIIAACVLSVAVTLASATCTALVWLCWGIISLMRLSIAFLVLFFATAWSIAASSAWIFPVTLDWAASAFNYATLIAGWWFLSVVILSTFSSKERLLSTGQWWSRCMTTSVSRRRSKTLEEVIEDFARCCICMDVLVPFIQLSPCGHFLCGQCANLVSSCPICRASISERSLNHSITDHIKQLLSLTNTKVDAAPEMPFAMRRQQLLAFAVVSGCGALSHMLTPRYCSIAAATVGLVSLFVAGRLLCATCPVTRALAYLSCKCSCLQNNTVVAASWLSVAVGNVWEICSYVWSYASSDVWKRVWRHASSHVRYVWSNCWSHANFRVRYVWSKVRSHESANVWDEVFQDRGQGRLILRQRRKVRKETRLIDSEEK